MTWYTAKPVVTSSTLYYVSSPAKAYRGLNTDSVLKKLQPHEQHIKDLNLHIKTNDLKQPITMLHAAGLLTNCCVSELAPLASTGQIDNDDIRIKKVLAILFKHIDAIIPPTWDAAVTELAKCLRYNEAFHNCVSQLSD